MLAKMLQSPPCSGNALIALAAIPGPKADKALREALLRLSGGPLIGVIYAVAARNDKEAVPLLEKLAGGNSAASIAAMTALTRLDPRTAAALPALPWDLRLSCAERLDPTSAKAIYLQACAAKQVGTRLAGLAGLARLGAADGVLELSKATGDGNPLIGRSAIELLGRVPDSSATAALAAQLDKLDASRQPLVLGALARRKDGSARTAVERFLGHREEPVRVAAIAALGSLGDAGSVAKLAEQAGPGGSQINTAVEGALAELTGPGVDEAILRGIGSGRAEQRVVMIDAAVLRASSDAVPVLTAAVLDADPAVRAAAGRALGRLGDANSYAQLAGLLANGKAAARGPLIAAVAALGRRVSDPAERVAPLLSVLKRADLAAETQAAVLQTLAGIGGPEALAAVRQRVRLERPGPLRRRICHAGPLAGCRRPAGSGQDRRRRQSGKARVLALRAVIRLATPTAEAMQWLKRAEPLAKTPADKWQLLSACRN